jgi:hypothetical protein
MQRPKPTQRLLIQVCGGNQPLISKVHHGLYEVPLDKFYPLLNFDDMIAFALASWDMRELSPNWFTHQFVPSADVYDIFSKVFSRGYPWLNKFIDVTDEKLREKHEKMNPFKERDLRERLKQVDPEDVEILREKLSKEVSKYVFECQYEEKKRQMGGNNYRLVVMRFQPVFPKRGIIIPSFAMEITRMVSRYPTECNLL